MPSAIVTRPLPGPAAFASHAAGAVQSQAAILLGTAARVRGDHVATAARSAAARMPVDIFFVDSDIEFPLPQIEPQAARIHPADAGLRARSLEGFSIADRISDERPLTALATQLYAEPSLPNAAAIAAAALQHPQPLVRVAAANLALATFSEPAEAVAELERAVGDPDELVRDVAATTLARWNPESRALARLRARSGAARPKRPRSRTSMLIHGTFARANDWWQPGYPGNFHEYIGTSVWTDLYSAADRYDWSGGYSPAARSLAASRLVAWVRQRGLNGLSLMTHSHGGNVAMLAGWNGLTVNRLVLLSCPVHPSTYSVNFAAVTKVVSIRVKLDLVLLADGSGSHFSDARYHEHTLPIWFNHSATHDPGVWVRYGVPGML